jgi:hypothetical protein
LISPERFSLVRRTAPNLHDTGRKSEGKRDEKEIPFLLDTALRAVSNSSIWEFLTY